MSTGLASEKLDHACTDACIRNRRKYMDRELLSKQCRYSKNVKSVIVAGYQYRN